MRNGQAREIEETAFYPSTYEVLRTLAARQKLAQWRNEQRELPYYKAGSRIFYKAEDLLKFIEAKRVEPQAA